MSKEHEEENSGNGNEKVQGMIQGSQNASTGGYDDSPIDMDILDNDEIVDHSDGLNFDMPPLTGSIEEEVTLNTIRDKYKNSGLIAVRPYCNANKENMGLEKYGMVVFPGTWQMADMASITFRGKTKYLNGLDEYAPSVQQIQDEEEKAAKIKQIRTIVAQLEREKAYNSVNVDDADFWSKVTMFRPDDPETWAKLSLKVDNSDRFLNPYNNLNDLLMVIAIENGGYPEIAPSFEDVRKGHRERKWYLDKETDSVETRTTSSRIKNRALGQLEYYHDKEPRKLFLVCKLLDPKSALFNYATSPNTIYDTIDNYIQGKSEERNAKKASEKFIQLINKDFKELKIRAVIKDAPTFRIIGTRGDQMIYKMDDGTLLGRNVAEVYAYLTNVINEEVLMDVMNQVEAHWKK